MQKYSSLGYEYFAWIRIHKNNLYLLQDYLGEWEPNEPNSRVYGLVISLSFETWNATLAFLFLQQSRNVYQELKKDNNRKKN